jgi:putative peptidoglycan lipid II flippase
MARSLYKQVGIASIIMMASVFLSNCIGLIREMVIAYIGGAGQAVDAYQVSFLIPEVLNHMVASGFLAITFIPIFSGYLAENKEDEGWRVFSIVLSGFGSLVVFFVFLSIFFAPELIEVIASGRPDPVFRQMVTRLTRIIMPAQFFFFVNGIFMAVQFAKERFAVPALAPLLYNLGIIGGGIFLGRWLGVEGFSWGVLAGAVANFFVQYRGAKKVGMRFQLVFDLKHPDLRKYVFLTLPLILGLSMTFSREFFFRFFGSFLPPGNIAGLNYGLRITLLPVALFGQAVGTASFPFMARLVAENKMTEMNRLLNSTLRYLALVLPVSALLLVLRSEVVFILFQRGKFDAAATSMTADMLLYLLLGTFAFAAYTIVPRAYYAMQDTLFPAIYGTIAVLLSMPLYLLGLNLMGARGIALAVSLSGILQVFVLYAFWNKRSRNEGSREVYFFYAKMIVFSVLLGILLTWFKTLLPVRIDRTTFSGNLIISVATGTMFSIILLLGGYGLKIKGITEMISRLAGRVKRATD